MTISFHLWHQQAGTAIPSANMGIPGESCNAGAGLVWQDGLCLPKGLFDPPAGWVLDYLTPVLSIIVLIFLIQQSIKKGKPTWWLMIAIAAASTWWMETAGDWGQHLLYSPTFNHYHVDWAISAPHNPMWMPFTYAIYWAGHTWAILRLAQWYQKRHAGVSLGKAIMVFTVPLTFVWNIAVEGTAAYMGYWTYNPPIGPYLDMGRGFFPLMWPMLTMFIWPNLISWLVGLPEEQGLNQLEKFVGLGRWRATAATQLPAAKVGAMAVAGGGTASVAVARQGGMSFEALRLLAWIVVFNVTFFVALVVPLIGVRLLTNWGSFYLP